MFPEVPSLTQLSLNSLCHTGVALEKSATALQNVVALDLVFPQLSFFSVEQTNQRILERVRVYRLTCPVRSGANLRFALSPQPASDCARGVDLRLSKAPKFSARKSQVFHT
jgi:hypothetical protein